jgi:hypothetical protein
VAGEGRCGRGRGGRKGVTEVACIYIIHNNLCMVSIDLNLDTHASAINACQKKVNEQDEGEDKGNKK